MINIKTLNICKIPINLENSLPLLLVVALVNLKLIELTIVIDLSYRNVSKVIDTTVNRRVTC